MVFYYQVFKIVHPLVSCHLKVSVSSIKKVTRTQNIFNGSVIPCFHFFSFFVNFPSFLSLTKLFVKMKMLMSITMSCVELYAFLKGLNKSPGVTLVRLTKEARGKTQDADDLSMTDKTESWMFVFKGKH